MSEEKMGMLTGQVYFFLFLFSGPAPQQIKD
jgi:hypothetical protein